MTDSTVSRHYAPLARLGLPIVIGQVGNIVLGFADTLMVGHHSMEELAAASFVNTMFMLFVIFAMGFSYGLTPIVGAMHGRGETGGIGQVVRAGLAASTLLAAALVGVLLAFWASLGHMGQPAELLPLFERGLLAVDAICKAFTQRGFGFTYFPTVSDALTYLTDTCAGKSVSLGGSMTLQQLGFPKAFSNSTAVHWHWVKSGEFFQTPDIYLSSANALSESGEVVNIDGACNRVSGTLFGPKRCIFVCGINKLCPDLASAIDRARNVAAPMNAKRLEKKTPCAVDGKCHDCRSPERVCRGMTILMYKMMGMEKCELVLIDEDLGM